MINITYLTYLSYIFFCLCLFLQDPPPLLQAHYWIKLCSFICLLSFQKENKVSAKLEFTPSQYHVQTDDGNQRFFKYQTWSGQYRKETRLDDGSVVGSYGWIDANGILRMYEYIADSKGYRVTKDRAFQVEDNATKEGR